MYILCYILYILYYITIYVEIYSLWGWCPHSWKNANAFSIESNALLFAQDPTYSLGDLSCIPHHHLFNIMFCWFPVILRVYIYMITIIYNFRYIPIYTFMVLAIISHCISFGSIMHLLNHVNLYVFFIAKRLNHHEFNSFDGFYGKKKLLFQAHFCGGFLK